MSGNAGGGSAGRAGESLAGRDVLTVFNLFEKGK